MPDLSDRQHDAFDNAAKMACRDGSLRVLREAGHLLWEDSTRRRLRCDWCELRGATTSNSPRPSRRTMLGTHPPLNPDFSPQRHSYFAHRHRRRVASQLPERRWRPSAEKTRLMIPPVCPSKRRTSLPLSRLKSRMT